MSALYSSPYVSVWCGTWNSTTAYVPGNGVVYNGVVYVCAVANTNQAPSGVSNYWIIVAVWLPGAYVDATGALNSKYDIPVVDLGTPGSGATARLSGQVNSITIANACTLQFPTGVTGNRASIEIWITNGGAATITWNPVPTWASGAPTLNTSGKNIVYCESIDGWATVIAWKTL